MEPNQETFEYDILGQRYPIPRMDGESHTKEHILVNATLLFARLGYATVSMRDIAKSIGIKPASLYNHFISKEALWNEAVEHAKELYLLYFRHLDDVLSRAETFEEVLDTMFIEPKRLANIFTCYAFSMLQSEQYRDDRAASVFNDVLLKYSIDFLGGWFDKCVERGLVDPFDTRIVATLFMHCVIAGLNLKVQERLGRDIPYDPSAMFVDLQRFILRAVGKDG